MYLNFGKQYIKIIKYLCGNLNLDLLPGVNVIILEMKYALFDFHGDESELEVGESGWIKEVSLNLCNNEAFDFTT
jgi:hypothetical protein